ncbi:tRNA pseudouridine(38-40) synthase TruA [Dehalococcoidia bacterium]|nr:tRNA pseudouridine(38-40) synthase TruA [Dehalococcoidia bacterium]
MRVTTKRSVALVIEYDGTSYAGFQLQANAPTIQGELEKAIARLTETPTRVYGAGRTDSGVHAQGQVVAFSTKSRLPCKTIVGGLTHFLSKDIAVREAYNVPTTFDPRRHASSRVYRYTLLNRTTRAPLLERYAYRVMKQLDDKAMVTALRLLEGRHDFASLASALPPGKDTVREVYATTLWRGGDVVRFEIKANAFLPHQMRRIGGLLVAVGTGRLSTNQVNKVMGNQSHEEPLINVSTLPPQGLCLMQVNYKDFPTYDYETD